MILTSIYHHKEPHSFINALWKAVKNSSNTETDDTKVVVSLHCRNEYFYSRAEKKPLHRIGTNEPHKAKYLLHTLLGDASVPSL